MSPHAKICDLRHKVGSVSDDQKTDVADFIRDEFGKLTGGHDQADRRPGPGPGPIALRFDQGMSWMESQRVGWVNSG